MNLILRLYVVINDDNVKTNFKRFDYTRISIRNVKKGRIIGNQKLEKSSRLGA